MSVCYQKGKLFYQKNREKWWFRFGILLALTNLIFFLLYFKFLVGDAAYIYTDIGSDTMEMSYPFNLYIGDKIRHWDWELYSLNAGLGSDVLPIILQYLNPIQALLLLFPERYFHWGLILVTCLKLNIISIFSFKYFKSLFSYFFSACICALFWTFSSFTILWGQHYSFCTVVMMFTLFLYYMKRFFVSPDKAVRLQLVLVMAFFMISSYYYFYMTGIFSIFFGLAICLYHNAYTAGGKMSLGRLAASYIKKMLSLFLAFLFAAGLAFVALFPTIHTLFASSRVEGAMGVGIGGLFHVKDSFYLLSTLARFFGNDTLGVGSAYTGAINYYEIGMYFTSSLFLLALIYLVLTKTYRKLAILFLAGIILSTLFPLVSFLFTSNPYANRWTFIICFIEVLTIGFMAEELGQKKDKGKFFTAVLAWIIFEGILLSLLFYGQRQAYYQVNKNFIYGGIGFLFLYLLCFFLLFRDKRKIFILSFLVVLTGEVIITNRPALYEREYVKRQQLFTSFYNDGSKEALDYLRQKDGDIYRVNKTYKSGGANDSMVQNYRGMSIYNTTNSKAMSDFKKEHNVCGNTDNFFEVDYRQPVLLSLLGNRYVISKTPLKSLFYEEVERVEDKIIYRNKYALPFGYLYEKEADTKENREDNQEKQMDYLSAFSYTQEEEGQPSLPKADEDFIDKEIVDLYAYIVGNNSCSYKKTEEGMDVSVDGADPFLEIATEDLLTDTSFSELNFSVETDRIENFAIYMSFDDLAYDGEMVIEFQLSPEKNTYSLEIPNDVSKVRLDMAEDTKSMHFNNLSLFKIENDTVLQNLYADLGKSSVRDISFENASYKARVIPKQKSMFCIPLLYDGAWRLTVNGKEQKLYNINGGLCGVYLEAGDYQVTLSYDSGFMKVGAGISLVFGLVLVGYAFSFRKRKEVKHE